MLLLCYIWCLAIGFRYDVDPTTYRPPPMHRVPTDPRNAQSSRPQCTAAPQLQSRDKTQLLWRLDRYK